MKPEHEIILAAAILVVLFVALGVYRYILPSVQPIINTVMGHSYVVSNTLKSVFGFLVGLSIVMSFVLFIGIIFVVEGLKRARKKEEEIFDAKVDTAFEEQQGDPELSKRWERVQSYVESQNENDWRQAIIEADIMLEDLLVKLGYQGEGIGERLRRVESGDFDTLKQAGEAHGVRNRIAHDGANYLLNQIEARRVINLYQQVFEEFYHI